MAKIKWKPLEVGNLVTFRGNIRQIKSISDQGVIFDNDTISTTKNHKDLRYVALTDYVQFRRPKKSDARCMRIVKLPNNDSDLITIDAKDGIIEIPFTKLTFAHKGPTSEIPYHHDSTAVPLLIEDDDEWDDTRKQIRIYEKFRADVQIGDIILYRSMHNIAPFYRCKPHYVENGPYWLVSEVNDLNVDFLKNVSWDDFWHNQFKRIKVL